MTVGEQIRSEQMAKAQRDIQRSHSEILDAHDRLRIVARELADVDGADHARHFVILAVRESMSALDSLNIARKFN